MTAAVLKNHTARDHAQMAKAQGVVGWHSMRKEELVKALLKHSRQRRSAMEDVGESMNDDSAVPTRLHQQTATRQRISEIQSKLEASKNIGSVDTSASGRQI